MMVNDSDLDVGQIYEIDIPSEETLIRVEFRETTADGRYVFRQLHIAIPIMIDKFVWDGMRSTGAAVLLERDGQGNPMVEREIDPASLLDPDEGGITVNERYKRLRAAQLLKEARTLRFYVMRYDEDPSIGRGHVSIDRFVLEHSKAAKEAGFEWLPSAGSILRAVKECGTPNSRPLSAFYDERGKHDRARRWPTEVLELAAEASTFYWAKRANRLVDAIQLFIDGFKKLRVERESLGPITPENPYNRPTEETIRNWIKAEMNIFTWANKYGEKDAMRRFRGRGRALQATRPLELVMFDHKAAARVAFMLAMGQALPGQKFAQQRKLAPLLDPRPELVPGNAVTITELHDGETVIHDMADQATRKERKSTKGVRRGGMPATEKAMQTKARKKKARQEAVEAAQPKPVEPSTAAIAAMEEIDDAMSRLAAITNKIKKANPDD